MPTYEYQCQAAECQCTWEQEQSIKDNPLTHCIKCHQETAKRLISNTAFVLSGGGVGWGSSGYSGK
jgi:putative FmdB family regulatory protein